MKIRKWMITLCFFGCILLLSNQSVYTEVGNSGGFGTGGSGWDSGSSLSSSEGGNGGASGGFDWVIGIGVFALLGYVMYARHQKNFLRLNKKAVFNNTVIKEEDVIDKIKQDDPNFSEANFKEYVELAYVSLQEAWQAKDWKNIRPFESNELFNMHQRQLQEYIDKKKTNYLERKGIQSITLAEYHADGVYEVLVVRLNASLLDYTMDDATDKILEGSKHLIHNRSYRLEFIRKVGVKTIQDTQDMKNCPNCGASAYITSSGECEYCHSLITSGEYGWVLNKYGAWH